MPFQRGSATNYRNLLVKLDAFLKNQHIRTVAVNAGGTGYVVGDLLSVLGGTVVESLTARLEVLAISTIAATGILTLTGLPLNTETVVVDTKTYAFQTTLTDVDGNVVIGANASDSIDNLIAAMNLGTRQTAATEILTLTGLPLNIETVVLDVKTYTFQTTLTDVDGNVLIGANASDSLDNLIAAITLGAGSGTTYAAATTLHPTVTASAGVGDTADMVAKTAGLGGNTIATTETLTNGSFGGATMSGGIDHYAAAMTAHPTVGAATGVGDTMDLTADTGGVAGNSIATTETLTNGSFGGATLSGGVDGIIASVRIYDAGAYSSAPSLTANAVTGGAGSSATLDLTMTYQHVRDVAVNAGGTGYVVDDLLTVLGGTPVNSRPAVIKVTSVSGGVIDGVEMSDWGTYSANPSLTANAVTGGAGSSATMDLTMILGDWAQRIANVSATVDVIEVGSVAEIDTAGTGYSVSDVLTLDSTAGNTAQATFTVGSIDGGGGVVTVALTTKGDYSGMESGDIATTGGSGSGCRIDPVFQPTRDEYLWEGAGSGTEQVYIGLRTVYSVAEDQVSWQLAGFSGWNGSSDWEAQSGISPGNSSIDPVVNLSRGSYTLLSETTINFWFRATERAIIFIPDMSGNQQSGHIGLLDGYGTDVEIPYPMFVCGTSDLAAEDLGSASMWVRGIADPTAANVSNNGGPGFFRTGGGLWEKVWNGVFDGNDINTNEVQDFFVYPTAEVDTVGLDSADGFAERGSGDFAWRSIIDSTKDGSTSLKFKPSPDSGGDLYLPVPCVVIQSAGTNKHKVMGEINGLFWVSAEDGLAAGDKITIGSRVFRVFKMGVNSLVYAHFCIEEN